ncbi:TPA: hypothetical protein ACX6NV_002035 [Photobacterium damselae]
MAKISAAQRAANKEQYDEVIVEMFWESGWDSITLNTVSDRLAIRKSTVQNYYPSKLDFGEALRGKVFPVAMDQLDLSNPDEFKMSWEIAIKSDVRFRRVVHLLISNATSETTSGMTVAGIVRLKHLLSDKWDSDKLANDAVNCVLGLSVTVLAEC